MTRLRRGARVCAHARQAQQARQPTRRGLLTSVDEKLNVRLLLRDACQKGLNLFHCSRRTEFRVVSSWAVCCSIDGRFGNIERDRRCWLQFDVVAWQEYSVLMIEGGSKLHATSTCGCGCEYAVVGFAKRVDKYAKIRSNSSSA